MRPAPRRLAALCAALGGVLSLSGCFTGEHHSPTFGFRLLDGGVVEVAYPLCPSSEVTGVQLLKTGGSGADPLLWKAEGPRTEAVRRGLFVVNAPTSFRTTTAAVTLPDVVYVHVLESETEDSRTAVLDLPKLRAFHAAGPDSYLTPSGPETRAQVDAHMGCNRPTPT